MDDKDFENMNKSRHGEESEIEEYPQQPIAEEGRLKQVDTELRVTIGPLEELRGQSAGLPDRLKTQQLLRMEVALERAVAKGEAAEAEAEEARKEAAAKEAEVQRLEGALAKQAEDMEAVVKATAGEQEGVARAMPVRSSASAALLQMPLHGLRMDATLQGASLDLVQKGMSMNGVQHRASIEQLQAELCELQEEAMTMPKPERKAAKKRIEALKRCKITLPMECRVC